MDKREFIDNIIQVLNWDYDELRQICKWLNIGCQFHDDTDEFVMNFEGADIVVQL